MNIMINKKSGRRFYVLDNVPYTLPDGIATLRQLIEAVVRQEVENYNSRGTDNMLVPFLTDIEISEKSASGKVGFGRLYSDKKDDMKKATETALQGFEDGLFRVLIGNTEITELDAPLGIGEGDILTFIRLTFLAGRLW